MTFQKLTVPLQASYPINLYREVIDQRILLYALLLRMLKFIARVIRQISVDITHGVETIIQYSFQMKKLLVISTKLLAFLLRTVSVASRAS